MNQFTQTESNVNVKVCSFLEFFEKEAIYPVGIDTYQRPYIWGIEKVQELIDDLSEYLSNSNGLPYYMGNILLHKNDKSKKLYIIDGQQRITTLSILYFILNGKLIDNNRMSMEYHSPLSAQNIKKAQELFISTKKTWNKNKGYLFSNIHFTFITTLSEDLAFTFFDTQNNRGVKLNPTDLLKAYHLRAIGNAEHFSIQKYCAIRWEKLQLYDNIFGQKNDFVAELFHQFLWRSRMWSGQKVIYREEDSDVINEFQHKALHSDSVDKIPLYPNSNNSHGKILQKSVNQGYTIHPNKIESIRNSAYLPFTLRQPIYKGLGFFLYSEKYADIVHLHLFNIETKDTEIKAFLKLYTDVWTNISLYLKELFVLTTVMYYDKFASERLLEFALWLDHVLGSIRLEKQYIFKEAPMKFLKDSSNNILDIISQAFRPEDVISFLKNMKEVNNIYSKDKSIAGKGVQGIYKDNVLKYYIKSDFTKKDKWISSELIDERKRVK